MKAITPLKEQIYSTLANALDGQKEVSLAIFPNHWNVGDSAIWWACIVALKDLNIKVKYVCSFKTYSKQDLLQHSPAGPILLCGGGNFGDMYMDEQGLREAILTNHPDRKIIQLPQSIWFKSEDEGSRVAALVNNHPDFTLLLRDQQSLAIARSLSIKNTKLCPDMAFYLDGELPTVSQNTPPSYKLTVLQRVDGESGSNNEVNLPVDPAYRLYDWHQENDVYLSNWSLKGKLALKIVTRWISNKRTPMGIVLWATHVVSKERTLRGIDVINNSEIAITDRLHAGILSLLIGQETILVDNSYGKNRAVYSAWMEDIPSILLTPTLNDALGVYEKNSTMRALKHSA